MAHLYSQLGVLYLWTPAASLAPLHLAALLCLVFSSAVTALAFKLSTVITRASHFNKSAVNVIPRERSVAVTDSCFDTLYLFGCTHTRAVGGLTLQ